MMSFNADGSLQFNNTISKSQSSISDGGYYSSIVPIITAENLYVVYNNDVSTEGDMMLSYANNKGLIENKILVTGIPIKLQTMLEKSLVVRNFDRCVQVYNDWVENNHVSQSYTDTQINSHMQDEIARWHSVPKLTQ
jgi:hypothetical protein